MERTFALNLDDALNALQRTLETPTQKTKEVNHLTSLANGFMDMSGKNKKKEMQCVSVLRPRTVSGHI